MAYRITNSCVGCGVCVGECPVGAISMGENSIFCVVDIDTCVSCGTCSAICPVGAFEEYTPKKTNSKGMKLNVLLMGYTGVGKSALVNYLAGKDLAESGIKQGTGGMTRGINRYDVVLNGQLCSVADTEGLETGNETYWEDLMKGELDVDCEADIEAWPHVVVYCIGANSGRVQDREVEMIHMCEDAGYGVIVALTKADVASDEELKSLEDAVYDSFYEKYDRYPSLRFVPIVSKKTRSAQQEGREQLCEAIFDAWGDTVTNRLPNYAYDDMLFGRMPYWKNHVKEWIYAQDMSFFGRSKEDVMDDVNNNLREELEDIANTISSKQKVPSCMLTSVRQRQHGSERARN